MAAKKPPKKRNLKSLVSLKGLAKQNTRGDRERLTQWEYDAARGRLLCLDAEQAMKKKAAIRADAPTTIRAMVKAAYEIGRGVGPHPW